MENPFVYGEAVRGEYFADREEEIRELVHDLSRGQNVIVLSPRRFGKTSLILEVLDRLTIQGMITVYVDLYPITSKDRFIATFAKAIAKAYTAKIEQVFREVKRILPKLIPKIVIKDENIPEIEFGYDRSEDKTPLIDDLLETVHALSQKQKKRAAVVFDEFQEIVNWDDGEVERQMRSHFQMHRDVAYVFMGSKRHLMTELFRNRNRPFYRFGKHFPLSKIPEDKFAAFISDKFKAGGFDITPDAVGTILKRTEAHPYYTELLCSILWDRHTVDKRIEPEDVDRGVEEVVKREAHAYHELWDRLTPRSKQLLEALAVDPSPQIYSKEFLTRHSLESPSVIQRAAKSLERAEIIERENAGYMFTDIFFKLWINRRLL